MISASLLIASAAALMVLLLCVVAAIVVAQAAEDRDMGVRIRNVARRSDAADETQAPVKVKLLTGALQKVGSTVARTAIFSERDVLDIERALAAAGQDPRSVGLVFLGVKVILIIGMPSVALAYALISGQSLIGGLLWLGGGAIAGIFMPSIGLSFLRRPFMKALDRGLPDALDLLIVCAEAGLGLESAVQRVAKELEPSNRPTALEFATLSQELRMLPDRAEAFRRMGDRTGVEGFRRLGVALAQTLKYGTPLGKALRILAIEMRRERMLRIEDKAARLPALLVMPLIVFIMPALFIVLVGQPIVALGSALE